MSLQAPLTHGLQVKQKLLKKQYDTREKRVHKAMSACLKLVLWVSLWRITSIKKQKHLSLPQTDDLGMMSGS